MYEKGSVVDATSSTQEVQELTAGVAEKLSLEDEEAANEEKKRQSRGGKGLQRDEGAKLDKEAQKRAVSR